MKDKIVEDLKREFDIRSCVGIDKYKTTLQDNNKDDFLQHLKEELMDAALYIQNYKAMINDLEIVKEAIQNQDYQDAVKMLTEIQEDLKILALCKTI